MSFKQMLDSVFRVLLRHLYKDRPPCGGTLEANPSAADLCDEVSRAE